MLRLIYLVHFLMKLWIKITYKLLVDFLENLQIIRFESLISIDSLDSNAYFDFPFLYINAFFLELI